MVVKINPTITINNINLEIGLIAQNISIGTKNIINITLENNYAQLLELIINTVNVQLKQYKFADAGINTMIINILNDKLNIVASVNFTITTKNYNYSISLWNYFILGFYNLQISDVYNGLTTQQKSQLVESVISGTYFYIDNITFTTNSINYTGILIKNSLCSCISSTCEPSSFIISIQWT